MGRLSSASVMLSSLVRVLNQQKSPVGSGVVCGRDHVLTCAHVVAGSLGFPANQWEGLDKRSIEQEIASLNLKINVLLPTSEGFTWGKESIEQGTQIRTMQIVKYEPYNLWEGFPEEGSDTCILKIADGERPFDVHMHPPDPFVRKDEAIIDFRGSGVSKEFIHGQRIEGDLDLDERTNHRYQLIVPRDRIAILAGCSGSPIFDRKTNTLIGMISDLQTNNQRLPNVAYAINYESVTHLMDDIPQMKEPVEKRPFHEVFEGSFDREPQITEFNNKFKSLIEKGPAVIFTLPGLDADYPAHCKNRLDRQYVQKELDRIGISGKYQRPIALPLPKNPRFDSEDAWNDLIGKMEGTALGKNDNPQNDKPAIFFSELSQREIQTQEYIDLVKRIGAELSKRSGARRHAGAKAPIIFFALIKLTQSGAFKDHDDDDLYAAHMEIVDDFNAALCDDGSICASRDEWEGDNQSAALVSLPILSRFRNDDFANWFENHRDESEGLDSADFIDCWEMAGEDAKLNRWKPLMQWVRDSSNYSRERG